MPVTVYFLFALIVSSAGGFLLLKLKFPAGMLIGGIIAVSVFSVVTGRVHSPTYLSTVLQILSGTLIGSSFSKRDFQAIRLITVPAFLFILGMLINNLAIGSLIAWLSPLDLVTALAGVVPGGMAESFLMADQLGADVPSVAIMHLSRLLLSLLFFPSLIQFLLRDEEPYREEGQVQALREDRTQKRSLQIFYTMAVGAIAGFAGSFIPFIPVPAMLTSMLAVSLSNMFIRPTCFPRSFRRIAQILAGVLVGSKVTMDTILGLGELIVPVGIMLAGYLVFHTLIGLAVSKITGLNKGIALFCSIPAGASDIALIASDMEYTSPVIALLQMTRLVSCITIFPLFIKLFILIVP